MHKRVAFLSALLIVGLVAGAQAEEKKKELVPGKWYPTLETGFTLTQSTFSDNWSGGDKGSVVWTAILNGSLENQLKKEVNWSNQLKLAFGQTHQQKIDAMGERHWQRPEKSTDLVDFETIFRFTLGGFVDPYASGRFESQFQDASDPMGRTLTLNPMTFKESGGIARKFIDEEERGMLSRLGFTFRENRRRLFDNPAPDKATSAKMTTDGGLEWITDYNAKILNKRVTWTSKFTAYKALFYSYKDDFEGLTPAQLESAGLSSDIVDYPKAIDLDWENIFTTQITKIIAVNLYIRWVYDKYDNSVPPKLDANGDLVNAGDIKAAIRKAGQFKQTMSIALTYRIL